MTWAWQTAVDWWSLAHCWGWALVAYTAARWGPWSARRVFLVAVCLGCGWEAVEQGLVEPWLHFHEPPLNRLLDIVIDALGAWFGVTQALRALRGGRSHGPHQAPHPAFPGEVEMWAATYPRLHQQIYCVSMRGEGCWVCILCGDRSERAWSPGARCPAA